MKTLKSFTVILLFVSLLLSFLIQAQAQSRWSVAPTAGSLLQYISYREPGNTYHPKYGSFVGIAGHYQLSSKWSLSSGLSYMSLIRNTDSEELSLFKRSRNFNKFDYLQIPLYINFRPSSKRLSTYWTTGVMFAKHQDASIIQWMDGKRKVYDLDDVYTLKPNRFYAVIGIGASCRINDYWTIVAQPMFSYQLSNDKFNQFITMGNQVSYLASFQAQLAYTF
ncbi:outer membrane beta-barrel protein [Nibrella saemangeumensis]